MMDDYKHLIIVSGEQNVEIIDLKRFNGSRLTFGSRETNDICISSPIVSRLHGNIQVTDRGCMIFDAGSLNGLFRNGEKVQSAELYDGDALRIDCLNSPHTKGVVMVYSTDPLTGEWAKVRLVHDLTIGRSPYSGIRVNHPSISGEHARIFRGLDDWHIRCLGESGIIVNGKPLAEGKSQRLYEKDAICIATSKFIYSEGILIHNADTCGVALHIEGLSRSIVKNKKSERILSDVNIEINPNELIGIIGSTGSGKTTFLNAACGFERADVGTVRFNGLDLYQNFRQLSPMIGYVPQNEIIHGNLGLRRMLMHSARIRLAKDLSVDEMNDIIDKVLSRLSLHNQQDQLIRQLSNGQRKRACIAVELLANPSIFFLDEPTTGLDPHIGSNILDGSLRINFF